MNEIREQIKDKKNLKFIAKGHFGEVYKLEFKGNNYAIKTISKDKIDYNPDEWKRNYLTNALKNEVATLKIMSGFENSVKFYAFFTEETEYVMVLEFCDTDLNKLLKLKGQFTSLEILDILEKLNKPFKYMHSNDILHRDIKPENILIKFIDSTKTKFIPKIGDYGISRKLEDGKATTILGTPLYMSPEILMNKNEYDDKSDLFSLGIMIYQLHFQSFPFKFPKTMGELKKNYTAKKEKDCEDKLLDDLINKLLVFNSDDRISWDDYFKHPFFNQKKIEDLNNQLDNMRIYNEKEHQIIKVYDFYLEKMIDICVHFDASPKVNIAINECLKLRNESFFILGILGKYLEQIGISVSIEKQKNLDKNWQLTEYNKSIFQFICNSYILKSKYLLFFNIGENKIKYFVNNPNERAKFNEKIRKAIIKKYNLKDEEILTSNQRIENQKFTVIIVIKSNFNINMTKDELIKLFSGDEDLTKLESVDKELLIPKIKLNLEMLFPQEDNKENIWSKEGKRGGENYIPPIGWIKYGINIKHGFSDSNFDWITRLHQNEWCIAYCGITGINKTMEQIYENDNDIKQHQNKKVGVGVYCFSEPKLLEEFTETINVNGDNYKVGFMVRVKPDKIRVSEKNKNVWIVNGNDNELRPYGILIKKV